MRRFIIGTLKTLAWIIAIFGVIVLSWKYLICPTVIATEIEQYGEFEKFRGYSNLEAFPVKLPEPNEAGEYYYEYREGLFDPFCQIYLKCSYDAEGFRKEIQRLSQIRKEYDGRVQRIRYNTEDFDYPAYVAIFQNDGCYEYALLDEEQHTIIYVFLQWMAPEEIQFPDEYLPHDYDDSGNTEKSFSIYNFWESEYDGWHVEPRDISRLRNIS